MISLLVLAAIIITEAAYKPRLDRTVDGKVLLWYGYEERRYLVIVS